MKKSLLLSLQMWLVFDAIVALAAIATGGLSRLFRLGYVFETVVMIPTILILTFISERDRARLRAFCLPEE
jgi:hypothetical protein